MTIEGEARKIASISVRPDGSLIISLHAIGWHRDHGMPTRSQGNTDLHGKPIHQTRISFHTSPTSKHINAIKYTREYVGGERRFYYQNTVAIKEQNNFALVFARCCPRLSTANLIIKDHAKVTSIGEMDPTWMTLVLAMCISGRDREFRIAEQPDLTVMQRLAGDFRVTTIWSYIPRASYREGGTAFVCSPLEMGTTPDVSPVNGADEEKIISSFRMLRDGFFDEIRRVDLEAFPEQALVASVFYQARAYFKKGTIADNPRAIAHFTALRQKCKALGLLERVS